MTLTSQECAFLDSFGYLHLPGLLTEDIDWMIEEHQTVFERKGVQHDGTKRSTIVPFIPQSERLSALLDHPKVLGVIESLLGEDFNYIGGDGNYFSGDTGWHSDTVHSAGLYIKFHLYLDPLTRDTGALRVIPGSHLLGEWRDQLEQVRRSDEALGVDGRDVPCVAVETEPGDVVVFNHHIYHASFGGGPRRRHFCLNVASRAKTEAEIAELDRWVIAKGAGTLPTDIMLETASAQRMHHLEQVLERERCLAVARPELRDYAR